MSDTMKIGMIGLDTSHVVAFAKLLNNANNEYHIPGARIIVAYPGGSPDFELSASRVEGFTNQLRDEFGVAIVDSPEKVAEQSDAIMLESVDGRVHLEQFRRIAPYGKPVFIDKPFAVSSSDAQEMFRLAERHNVPLMSSSSLRYAEALKQGIQNAAKGAVIGADTYGPMHIVPTQPAFFWYGIHCVDMLYAILGTGCVHVSVETTEHHDVIVGQWKDGRIGVVRGNRKGNGKFGAVIHREKGSDFVDIYSNPKPYYASMLEDILEMFRTRRPGLAPEETLEVIRFIEAANESRETGRKVIL
jgi:predicted dehydrogenase